MNFAPNAIQQSRWVTRRSRDEGAPRSQLRQVSHRYGVLTKGSVLASGDDSYNFGAGRFPETYSATNRILVFPELVCQRLVDDRHTALPDTFCSSEVATSQQRDAHGLEVVGCYAQYV